MSTTCSQTDRDREPEPNLSQRITTYCSSFSGSGTVRGESRRLLFLDDDPRRAEAFLVENPEAVWVKTVRECLSRLTQPWDEVHLDHDLGGKQFVDTGETECGMEVIRWLCQEPRLHLRQTFFWVHTHNTMAGLMMVLHMRESGYRAEFRPFGVDLSKVLLVEDIDECADLNLAGARAPTLARWWVRLRSFWSLLCGRAP
jgi:hypothetical protein